MKIKWHCRQCNKKGKTEVSILDLLKDRKQDESFLELASSFVRRTVHQGCNGDIGVSGRLENESTVVEFK